MQKHVTVAGSRNRQLFISRYSKMGNGMDGKKRTARNVRVIVFCIIISQKILQSQSNRIIYGHKILEYAIHYSNSLIIT